MTSHWTEAEQYPVHGSSDQIKEQTVTVLCNLNCLALAGVKMSHSVLFYANAA